MKAGLRKVGKNLQKLNLGRLIDEMEQDQELAYQLEDLNQATQEEVERKELVREATALCQAEIETHLREFLHMHPDATYEDWIQDLHPDNITEANLQSSADFHVDARFYLIDSDHRLLWNESTPQQLHVAAKTYKGQAVDLLGD